MASMDLAPRDRYILARNREGHVATIHWTDTESHSLIARILASGDGGGYWSTYGSVAPFHPVDWRPVPDFDKPPQADVGYCYVLSIDNDDRCEVHLFHSDAERDEFMWEYAFENTDNDIVVTGQGEDSDFKERLADFKALYNNDIADAMEDTHDGWLLEDNKRPELPPTPLYQAAEIMLRTLKTLCLSMDTGAHSDQALSLAKHVILFAESQVPADLVRDAAPMMLRALITAQTVLDGIVEVRHPNDILDVVREAIAKAEGRTHEPYVAPATSGEASDTVDAESAMIDALTRIRDARDYNAEHGTYPPGTLGADQQFDDWAADIAAAALAIAENG